MASASSALPLWIAFNSCCRTSCDLLEGVAGTPSVVDIPCQSPLSCSCSMEPTRPKRLPHHGVPVAPLPTARCTNLLLNAYPEHLLVCIQQHYPACFPTPTLHQKPMMCGVRCATSSTTCRSTSGCGILLVRSGHVSLMSTAPRSDAHSYENSVTSIISMSSPAGKGYLTSKRPR